MFNISVNLNSTCICTIVQGDIKEISFFFFFLYQPSEDNFRRYTCISSVGLLVCVHTFILVQAECPSVMGTTPKN